MNTEEPINEDTNENFSRMAADRRRGMISELMQWLGSNKKWWLLPLIIILLLLGVLVACGGSLGAFIYPLI